MRKKYYHAATPETMEKIIADGVVKRGWDGCVYLCEKPQDAAKFVAIRGHDEVPEVYDVTQPSVREVIGVTGSVRRATVIEDYAFTITTRQDRTPAQVIDCGKGRYRYLTELECWRLQGYTDKDFEKAKKAQQKKGRYYTALYKQAGNSIAVPIFESIFRKIILNEVREKEEQK